MLHTLRGHCNAPIAGWARHRAGVLELRGMVFTSDGQTILRADDVADHLAPDALGAAVATRLLQQGAREIIDSISH